MEDFTLADLPNETPSPNLPEAVQAPTQPVNLVFMVALTAAGVSLYILYTGIGALLLPYQVGLLAPKDKVVVLAVFTGIAVLVALVANPLAGALAGDSRLRL